MMPVVGKWSPAECNQIEVSFFTAGNLSFDSGSELHQTTLSWEAAATSSVASLLDEHD